MVGVSVGLNNLNLNLSVGVNVSTNVGVGVGLVLGLVLGLGLVFGLRLRLRFGVVLILDLGLGGLALAALNLLAVLRGGKWCVKQRERFSARWILPPPCVHPKTCRVGCPRPSFLPHRTCASARRGTCRRGCSPTVASGAATALLLFRLLLL